VRVVALAAVAALAACCLAGCGGDDGYRDENVALLATIPTYPGAKVDRTTHVTEGDVSFSARDWTLPRSATAPGVVQFYTGRLAAKRWQFEGQTDYSLAAHRGAQSLDLAVHGRTLEVIANARGAAPKEKAKKTTTSKP
jgi:hypothetical protein